MGLSCGLKKPYSRSSEWVGRIPQSGKPALLASVLPGNHHCLVLRTCLPTDAYALAKRSCGFGPLRPAWVRDTQEHRPYSIVAAREDAHPSGAKLVGGMDSCRASRRFQGDLAWLETAMSWWAVSTSCSDVASKRSVATSESSH